MVCFCVCFASILLYLDPSMKPCAGSLQMQLPQKPCIYFSSQFSVVIGCLCVFIKRCGHPGTPMSSRRKEFTSCSRSHAVLWLDIFIWRVFILMVWSWTRTTPFAIMRVVTLTIRTHFLKTVCSPLVMLHVYSHNRNSKALSAQLGKEDWSNQLFPPS